MMMATNKRKVELTGLIDYYDSSDEENGQQGAPIPVTPTGHARVVPIIKQKSSCPHSAHADYVHVPPPPSSSSSAQPPLSFGWGKSEPNDNDDNEEMSEVFEEYASPAPKKKSAAESTTGEKKKPKKRAPKKKAPRKCVFVQ